MATMLTGERLIAAVRDQTFIRGGDPACVEGVKYDFRMGNRLLKAGGLPIDTKELSEAERSRLVLEPGEIAFALSEETLNLPNNMVVALSPKRKLSHEGVLILGGFFVDPLYPGKLLVGLYNFSTSKWPLQPGKKMIAGVFYTLADDEIGDFEKPDSPIMDFPDDLVRVMQHYKPTTLEALQEIIETTKGELKELREEFRTQTSWKQDFQRELTELLTATRALEKSVSDLRDGLADEVKNRQAAERKIDSIGTTVTDLSKKRDRRRDFWMLTLVAVIGVLAGLLAPPLWRWLSQLINP